MASMSPAASSAPPRARFTTIVLTCVLALVASVAAAFATSAPAAAHNALVSADPADGSTVEVAPERVTLTFDDEVIELGSVIEVFGPGGSLVSAGDVQVDGAVATQELAGELPAGAYTIVWRITSADGHPVEGELGFTATNGVVPAAEETTAPADEPAPSDEAPSPPATSAPAPAEQESTAPTDTTATPGDGSGVGRTALVVAGVLIAAAAGVTLLVRRSARKSRR